MNEVVLKNKTDLFDCKNFSKEDREKIESIKKTIDINNSKELMLYGVGAQKEISSFSDTILNEVKVKDAGYVKDILRDMIITIKDLKIDKIREGSSLFNKNPLKRFMSKYDKISTQLDKIIKNLDDSRSKMLNDIESLDFLYKTNLNFVKNLNIHITAGKEKIKEYKEKIIPKLKKDLDENNIDNEEQLQYLNDLSQSVERFEKKIYDLMLSRVVAIQTAPQIRIIQNNNQTLVEKIQSSVLNTIPMWKNQIVISIALYNQQKGLNIQRNITKTTNDLLKKNSSMLKQNSIGIAKENEKTIIEIDTLKKVSSDLVSTIEEIVKIQEEGRKKRKDIEKEIMEIEVDLKKRLAAQIEDKKYSLIGG